LDGLFFKLVCEEKKKEISESRKKKNNLNKLEQQKGVAKVEKAHLNAEPNER
jgi:hypothetical protein